MRTTILFSAAALYAFTGLAAAGDRNAHAWAQVAGYHLGMSKDAAKAAGLANCKGLLGTVECNSSGPVTIGSTRSISSRIELDERTGRIERIEFQFPDAAYQAVASAIVQQLGPPSAKDGDFEADDWMRRGYHSSCMSAMVWYRGGDQAVVVCGQYGRRGSVTHVVADQMKGRGKEWREAVLERKKSQQSSSSFDSK